MKTKRIIVTKRDILMGVRKSPHCCPIAHALKRAFPGWHVAVGNYYLEFTRHNTQSVTIEINNKQIENWIVNYDDALCLEIQKPTQFNLQYDEVKLNG